MAIIQTINFNSTNNYFAGFLQELIKQSGINGEVAFGDYKITLTLDDSDSLALEEFSKLCNRYLPYSLFLGDINTSMTDTNVTKSDYRSENYDIALCPKCLEMITRPDSPHYLSDTVICNHYSNTGKSVEDYTTFSPHYSEGCSVLLTDATKVDDLFIMTDEEKKALFSIEKPSIKVTVADETLKELTGTNYIWIKSPSTIKSTLIALNAKDSDVSYLFFHDNYQNKAVVVQKNILFLQNHLKPLENLATDPIINKFSNIKKEAGFEAATIGAELSYTNGISFILSDSKETKEVIRFEKFDLQNVLNHLKNDANKSQLLVNFEKKYPQIIDKLFATNTGDLFEAIAIILELNGSFESVSDKSLEFRGNGGVKMDTNFTEGGMDYSAFLSTMMSFKLADTPNAYLAYSVFESLADMIISILNQLKTKFKTEHFIMMGDMFENSVVYSRILSKFSLSNPYFSKEIGIK